MADYVWNDITLHKPLPVRAIKAYVDEGLGVDTYMLHDLMGESNIIVEPLSRPDGYGGQRQIGHKLKLTFYYNRFDGSVEALKYYAEQNTRFPLKVYLGDSGRVAGEGSEVLSFTQPETYLTFNAGLQSAEKFLKSSFVWNGVIHRKELWFTDIEP